MAHTVQMLYPLEFIGFMTRVSLLKNMGGSLTTKHRGGIPTIHISKRGIRDMWVIKPYAC